MASAALLGVFDPDPESTRRDEAEIPIPAPRGQSHGTMQTELQDAADAGFESEV
jgi:hypothetical protein